MRRSLTGGRGGVHSRNKPLVQALAPDCHLVDVETVFREPCHRICDTAKLSGNASHSQECVDHALIFGHSPYNSLDGVADLLPHLSKYKYS